MNKLKMRITNKIIQMKSRMIIRKKKIKKIKKITSKMIKRIINKMMIRKKKVIRNHMIIMMRINIMKKK